MSIQCPLCAWGWEKTTKVDEMKIKFKMPWTSKSPLWYFAGGIVVKNPPLNAGDVGWLDPWSGN